MTYNNQNKLILLTNAPKIDGLVFRHFRKETDYAGFVEIWDAMVAKGLHEGTNTPEDLEIEFSHRANCDLSKDAIIAEVKGKPVGFGLTWWDLEKDQKAYYTDLDIHPDYDGQGIDEAMMVWLEERIREVSLKVPGDPSGFLVQGFAEIYTSRIKLLEKMEYTICRKYYSMSRDLQDIPEIPLPEGIIVKPALPSQYHLVWEKSNEAFSEHWGFTEPREEYYQS